MKFEHRLKIYTAIIFTHIELLFSKYVHLESKYSYNLNMTGSAFSVFLYTVVSGIFIYD